ncbi:protease SohB [Catenovulum sp. 2E275]|uniref:protease SohB n=1 Tax=Catenovulum sp. 2E275 TaxID=2980497 RepID=UPI0021D2A186|nr:protease SohB [Catenovulum sp. 2E275]MCU4674549.1 protease SohB [Catenovulum sp. 2E275]
MEFLYEYGLFLAKTITFIIAFVIILALAASAKKGKSGKKGELEVTNLTERFNQTKSALENELLDKEALKLKEKQDKAQAKSKAKEEKQKAKAAAKQKSDESTNQAQKRVFVIDFKGSVDAHEVDGLREEISAVLAVATPADEVLIKLESGGGVVHGYGLAASQLARIKAKQIPLTIAIDKVAASGGYMMACVADKIISAPFAIVGSIGVIAQLPNFNKVLKNNNIEFEQITAGEFKRTLTMFGENTDKAREKFKSELEEIHHLFVAHISEFRNELNVEKVATGEHWMGSQALSLGLVDELKTSDDYIFEQVADTQVFQIKYKINKGVMDKLPFAASSTIENIFMRLYNKVSELKFR